MNCYKEKKVRKTLGDRKYLQVKYSRRVASEPVIPAVLETRFTTLGSKLRVKELLNSRKEKSCLWRGAESAIRQISSLSMTPCNEQLGTAARLSNVRWYNLQTPFFRQAFVEDYHLKKRVPIERPQVQCVPLNNHTNFEKLLDSLAAHFMTETQVLNTSSN